MKKITIKRFLNKRIKPIQVYDDIEDLGYPLYYSITYNRKTQHIKSLTGAVMTEKAFEHLQETGEPLHFETNYFDEIDDGIRLQEEIIYLEKAVKFIVIDNGRDDIFDKDFTKTLKKYFENLEVSLFDIGWFKYKFSLENLHHIKEQEKQEELKRNKGKIKLQKALTYDDIKNMKFELTEDEKRMNELYKDLKNADYEMQNLYYSFNKNKNLIAIIRDINKMIGKDKTKYFYNDTLKVWYVIHLITIYHDRNSPKIDFLLDFDPAKYIELNQKYQYPVTDNEINLISNELKYKALFF